MRTKTLVTYSLVVTLACGAALVHACYPPPIWINVVDVLGGRGPTPCGTVEVVATVPASVEADRINFFVDGKWIGTDATMPYRIKWDTTTVRDGKHELHALGSTPDGYVLKSNILAVVVDNEQDSKPEL